MDTDEAALTAGDLLNAFSSGSLSKEAIVGDLTAMARGTCAIRTSDSQRTIFKAVGTALEDLAAAKLAYRQLQAGHGQA